MLPARTYGESKMDRSEISRSVRLLFTLFLTTLMNRERYNIVEPLPAESFDKNLPDEQGWDGYWSGKAKVGPFYMTLLQLSIENLLFAEF